MLLTITKRHEWDMGHRLGKGYTSKCKHLHGHRYVAEMTFTCDGFDPYDMVIDFGTVKQVCGGWIDDHLDHSTLVYEHDTALLEFLYTEENRHLVVPFNTTVENMAPWLAAQLQLAIDGHPDLAARNVCLVELRVNETPNGWAIWHR